MQRIAAAAIDDAAHGCYAAEALGPGRPLGAGCPRAAKAARRQAPAADRLPRVHGQLPDRWALLPLYCLCTGC